MKEKCKIIDLEDRRKEKPKETKDYIANKDETDNSLPSGGSNESVDEVVDKILKSITEELIEVGYSEKEIEDLTDSFF